MKRVFLFLASSVALIWLVGLILTFFPPHAGSPRTEVNLAENFRLTTLTFDDAGSFIYSDEDEKEGNTRPSSFRCLVADLELLIRKRRDDDYLDNGLTQEYLDQYGRCGSADLDTRAKVINTLSDPDRFGHTVSLIYIHGWKGSGEPDNDNHVAFKNTVKKLAANLNQGAPNAHNIHGQPEILVNGIYLGWQGSRTAVTALEPLFFYKSKKIADEVSRGHMNLVLHGIDRFYREVKDASRIDGPKHNFISIGHSFGGRILFNMTSDILYERVLNQASDLSWSEKMSANDFSQGRAFNQHIAGKSVTSESTTDTTESKVVDGFGDLVVLLNPAFEASRYVLLNDLDDRINFSKDQVPVLYTVSSALDKATHLAFPASRWYETNISNRSHLFSTNKRSQLLDTAGNHAPFRTHLLEYGEAQSEDSYGASSLVKAVERMAESSTCEHGNARLSPTANQQTDTPFVIAYDELGKMMKDHNDIFNDCVTAHLSQVIYNEVVVSNYY